MKVIFWLMMCGQLLSYSFNKQNKPAIHIVEMSGMRFSPATIEIKKGETVRWINRSNSTHNVVANNNDFKSDWLSEKGDQFEYTFKTPGAFKYYCEPHRIMGMKGMIVVK